MSTKLSIAQENDGLPYTACGFDGGPAYRHVRTQKNYIDYTIAALNRPIDHSSMRASLT